MEKHIRALENRFDKDLKGERLTSFYDRDQAALLFGRSIAEHWPVEGDHTGYEWVREELQLPETIVLGIKNNAELIACMAATPLHLMWNDLKDEERALITAGIVALPDSKGIEIPTQLTHLGSIAVKPEYRGRQYNFPEKMFAAIIPLIQSEIVSSFLVAQTARPNGQYPNMRGLVMCLRLGFAEITPNTPKRKTVGGLEKVWLAKKI